MACAKEIIDAIGAKALLARWHECRASLARQRNDRDSVDRELEAARRRYAELGALALN